MKVGVRWDFNVDALLSKISREIEGILSQHVFLSRSLHVYSSLISTERLMSDTTLAARTLRKKNLSHFSSVFAEQTNAEFRVKLQTQLRMGKTITLHTEILLSIYKKRKEVNLLCRI